tara:strand:- start:950 stop:1480 length:531 start_codon:yes stop_codon:yes gene_type:complete
MFLDRDGVINEDNGYVSSKKDFIFKKGIISFLRKAQDKYNYKFIIVTNQSGIGRGYFDEDTFLELTSWLNEKLLDKGIKILDTFYCPFHPEFGIGKYKRCSNDRKPRPGMIMKAAKKYNISLKDSVLLGDRLSDIEAAKSANVGKAFLFSKNINYKYKELEGCVLVDDFEKIFDNI